MIIPTKKNKYKPLLFKYFPFPQIMLQTPHDDNVFILLFNFKLNNVATPV